MRAKSVIARIHAQNGRSLSAFERCGFTFERETPTLLSLSISFGQYLNRLREGSDGCDDIYVTEVDQDRLQGLIEIEQGPATMNLEHEIERTIVTGPERVAADIVTMNSKVLLRLGHEEKEVALVYPGDADERTGNLSILSDIGAAILGCRVTRWFRIARKVF